MLRFDRDVAVNVLLKLVIMPLLILGLASVFAIGGNVRLALLLVAVTPTASGMAMIAAHYETYQANAAATVLLTTLLSLIAFPVVTALF
jgi:malonate transporter and related proteins